MASLSLNDGLKMASEGLAGLPDVALVQLVPGLDDGGLQSLKTRVRGGSGLLVHDAPV